MAQETSIWLNLCFVEKILRNSESDNSIQVTNICSEPATSKGDNYTSDIIRIIADFSCNQGGFKNTKKKSIIIKISPTLEDDRKKLVTQSGYFHNEALMMSDTLDKMNKLLGPNHRLSGKILYVQNENPTLLVIEDLAPLGFRLADRSSGFDLAHSVLALRGLARFHAASVALCEKEPKQKEMYLKGIFHKQHPPEMKNIFIKSTKALADEIANWPEVKKYSEKIAKLSDHIYQIGINASKLFEDEFNVINHGDFQMNNILFKYNNNGKPIDYILVDFQMCVYTSPAFDLLCFLNSSTSFDVIEYKKDVLLSEYLDMLTTTMKQLNCKTEPPTMKELKAILKRRASLEMLISFTVLPYMLRCQTKTDLNEIISTGTFIYSKNESFKQLMIKRLPLYDEWGLLDL
ncbi:PREDICTED: uncharacterized protein LOC105149522 [Acromyrmex echinatior]|nr:PREDICTED: uncharacterized protein LOC105149522 [Acromyrmex echinatior]